MPSNAGLRQRRQRIDTACSQAASSPFESSGQLATSQHDGLQVACEQVCDGLARESACCCHVITFDTCNGRQNQLLHDLCCW